MINKTISHYKIIEKLGQGGMGIVYKAQDLKLNRFIAIKFLPAHLTSCEDEKQRFIHEAKAASALEHNNICNIHEIDETEDGQLFISMAYYDGQTLNQKIKDKPLAVKEAIDITIQITQGLAKAHQKNIVHRDIKPANIMLTREGVVKILDFGLAKLSTQTKLTKESTTLGTVSYISPEQAKGEDVDPRTDIWSLGVIIFEMLTGQLPFKGEYESAVIYTILNDKQEPLTALRSGIPMTLEQLVDKALAKKASERYQHVDEMTVDLAAVKRQIGNGKDKNQCAETFSEKKKPIDSIAVLPFDNLSGDTRQDYFVNGMTEKLITELSKITTLCVRPRISSIHYKNSNKLVPEIAHELNVGTLLAGSALLVDDRVRISVQLIEAATESPLWTEDYERELVNVLILQKEIALAICSKIKVQLIAPCEVADDENQLVYPGNLKLYLQGCKIGNNKNRRKNQL